MSAILIALILLVGIVVMGLFISDDVIELRKNIREKLVLVRLACTDLSGDLDKGTWKPEEQPLKEALYRELDNALLVAQRAEKALSEQANAEDNQLTLTEIEAALDEQLKALNKVRRQLGDPYAEEQEDQDRDNNAN